MAEGDPPPRVVWLNDGVVFDTEVRMVNIVHYQPISAQMDPGEMSENQKRNTLVISPLERRHAGNILKCVAENNNVSHAPYTDIVLEINMPVMDIR